MKSAEARVQAIGMFHTTAIRSRALTSGSCGCGGGTVNLEFDSQRGAFVGAQESLSGTIRNCAGGPTP